MFDKTAEIKLTGSRLEEEANMAEVEEDWGDYTYRSTDFLNALFMNDCYGF